jgi:hypothetical protein
VTLGSLVRANGIYLYLSLATKINIEGVNVIALSPQSPLGSKLLGNAVGYTFEIEYKVSCRGDKLSTLVYLLIVDAFFSHLFLS